MRREAARATLITPRSSARGGTEMTYTAQAVYEAGGLRLFKPIEGIKEHSIVNVTIEPAPALSKEDQLAMLLAVPAAESLADAIEEGRRRPWPPIAY